MGREGQAYMEHWALIHQVLQNHIELDKVRYSQHACERMEECSITKRMVQYILYHHEPTEASVTIDYEQIPITS